ncbi:helix-turn-helix domain-containing protein [Variovorax sp. LT2P21]|uniref:helix-turn-helix domain-containing protein n=1 Tax=Variovorax sp. LT2P21 TaxID=3443731 RepID=UPI003F479064
MGRKSKLTEDQWADVGRRLIDGEAQRALAREYGISEATLRQYFAKLEKLPTVQKVAGMIVETEAALKSLPISAQINAQRLADRLMAISQDLASAAFYGAKTAHRLNALANSEVAKVDDADPLGVKSVEAMKGVALMTRLANDSSSIAVNLLAANKEKIAKINEQQEPEVPPPVRPQISREEWLLQHGLS